MSHANSSNKISRSFGDSVKRFFDLNPTLVRGILVSVAAVLAQVLNRTIISDDMVQAIVDLFTAVAALVTALWARGVVIAEKKVVAWTPDPENGIVMPGKAATSETELADAAVLSMNQKEARQALAGDH